MDKEELNARIADLIDFEDDGTYVHIFGDYYLLTLYNGNVFDTEVQLWRGDSVPQNGVLVENYIVGEFNYSLNDILSGELDFIDFVTEHFTDTILNNN